MRKVRYEGGNAIFKLLLAVIVGLYFSLIGFRGTPVGIQCPTAPIQAVQVATTTNCACKVVKLRAPKPGDRAFVQCACSEKKESKALGSTVKETLGSPASGFAFVVHSPTSHLQSNFTSGQDWREICEEVPVKPPCA